MSVQGASRERLLVAGGGSADPDLQERRKRGWDWDSLREADG